MRNAIRPGKDLYDIARGRHTDRPDIGADIGIDLSAQGDDAAVRIAGDLQLALGFARVIGGKKIFAPVLDPFDGALETPRRERDQEIFRIEFAARAERAADIVFDQRDRGFRQIQEFRENAPVGEGHFGSAIKDHVPARFVPLRNEAASLHRHRRVPMYAEGFAARVTLVRLERRFRIAANGREPRCDIALGIFE